MGIKGDKLTGLAGEQAALLTDKLQVLGQVTSKRMFGGYGLFHQKKMFGIVNSKGALFLKYNGTNAHRIKELNSGQHGKKPYYYVPEPVVHSEELLLYAEESIRITKE